MTDDSCQMCDGKRGEYRYPEDDPLNHRLEGSRWYDCPACGGTGSELKRMTIINRLYPEFEQDLANGGDWPEFTGDGR